MAKKESIQFLPNSKSEANKQIKADLNKYGNQLILMLRRTLMKPPFSFKRNGGLVASLDFKVEKNGKMVLLGNSYISSVIYGRKRLETPMIPTEDIRRWLIRYKSRNNFIFNARTKNGKDTLNNLAFAIMKSIYKKGIRGRDFLTPTLNVWETSVERQISKRFDYYIDNYIDSNFVK